MTELFIKGGLIMWPLLLCSVLSLAISIERFVYFLKWNETHVPKEDIESAAQDEIEKMKRGLDVLDTIITMAPLLGILGTVIGIIDSFQILSDAGIETPRAVIGGIAKALITTATGLTVALGTLIPYNYFIAIIKKNTVRLNKLIVHQEMRRGS